MNIRIAQPLGYSETGGRTNNEDAIFPDPQHVSTQQKWFMVCDGVGGAERGEVASRLAVASLDTFLRLHPVSVLTPTYIQQAVAYAENQFNAYLAGNAQASGMATTVTLLYVHEAGITVVHIGDSRVYHIRRGQVIWQTEDHSYVAELVRSGVLTPEEAHRHPQRNVITRALQGGTKPVQASVHLIDDVQTGDYFFLCSDGVLERVSDSVLGSTLANWAESNEQKMNRLRACSEGNTRDNFTAYLIQIDQVTGAYATQSATTAPAYTSFFYDPHDENDEAVTLINAPIPEAVKQDASSEVPLPSPVSVDPTPVPAQPTRPSQPLPPAHAVAPVVSPARRSSGRWSVVAVALLGALLGVGGFLVWQQFAGTRAQPGQQEGGRADVTLSAITAVPPADVRPRPASPPDQRSDNPENPPAAGTDTHAPAEPTRTDSHSLPPADTDAADVVRQVDHQLLVIRDPQTRLLGLQRANGEPLTDRVYQAIGSFQNGVARIDGSRGKGRYLSKEGTEFTSFSGYKDGVATLLDLNGKEHYLSRGGKWLDEIKSPSNGKIAVCKNKRWGYLNLQGQVSIFLQYDQAGSFDDDGTAEVSLHGKTFRIDKKGDRIVGEPGSSRKDPDDRKSQNLSKNRDA